MVFENLSGMGKTGCEKRARQESNLRPLVPETNALSSELRAHHFGIIPEMNREIKSYGANNGIFFLRPRPLTIACWGYKIYHSKTNKGEIMKKILFLLLAVFVMTAVLSADVYIKQKTHTDAMEMMGHKSPAKDEIQEIWIGANSYAMNTSHNSTIIDLAAKKFWMVLHSKKSYLELSLPADFSKLMPEAMAGMYASMKMEAKVTPTGQTKKIGNWNCDGYNVEMKMNMMGMSMPMTQTIWASKDVPFDWKSFVDKIWPEVMSATFKTLTPANFMNEMKKIVGYPIYIDTHVEVMGAKTHSTSEVVEITTKPAPAGAYAPPAGYTKRDKLDMADMK